MSNRTAKEQWITILCECPSFMLSPIPALVLIGAFMFFAGTFGATIALIGISSGAFAFLGIAFHDYAHGGPVDGKGLEFIAGCIFLIGTPFATILFYPENYQYALFLCVIGAYILSLFALLVSWAGSILLMYVVKFMGFAISDLRALLKWDETP